MLLRGDGSTFIKIEKEEKDTFSARYKNLLNTFDYKTVNADFFDELVDKVVLISAQLCIILSISLVLRIIKLLILLLIINITFYGFIWSLIIK